MATKTSFPKVDFQASKYDEISWLKEAAASVASGTYLCSLLNPRFIEWFETQVKADFHTDIMDFYTYEKGIAQARGDELRKVRAELDKAEVDCEVALAEQKKSWELTLEAEKANSKFWTESAGNWQNLYETERELYNEVINQLGAEREKVSNLQADLAAAEDEIIRLKAKLYDMMTAA